MKERSSRTETYVSLIILAVLFVIAVGVFLKQFRYDQSLFTPSLPKEAAQPGSDPGATASIGLQEYLPEGMVVLSPPETFGPDTLSEKIDGKAELYLSAGFISLVCQRFQAAQSDEAWLEMFVYDMGSTVNAFAVFSTQRRADAESLDLTRFAYQTSNAIFFVHGQYYVEIVAAAEDMAESMLSLVQNFVSRKPVERAEEVSEPALFPAEHLVPGSVALLSENVFGFERLNRVFTADYALGEATVMAFLSRRTSPGEAAELTEAYYRFLLENGGVERPLNVDIPGARLIEIFDTFELLFSRDNLMIGVHEAESRELAEQLGLMLHRHL